MENLTATGAAGVIIAVVLILRTVFEFLEKMNARKAAKGDEGEPKCFTQKDRNLIYDVHRWHTDAIPQLAKLVAEIAELHRWHDRMDADGVPVWYVRSSLEESVGELSEAIKQLTESGTANTHLLEMLCAEMRSGRRDRSEDGI